MLNEDSLENRERPNDQTDEEEALKPPLPLPISNVPNKNNANDLVEEKTVKTPRLPKRVTAMYTTSDWWSLWVGLLTFAAAVVITFIVPYESGSDRVKYVVPQPMKWSSIVDSWDIYGAVGILPLFFFLGTLYITSLRFMGKVSEEKPFSMYVIGFMEHMVIAIISVWLGRNDWCSRSGLGYAIFAIVFGLIITNVSTLILPPEKDIKRFKLVAKDGEFFIKCSLVLLAVEFSVLREVGWQSIAVSWVGSPLALIFGFLIGTRLFEMETDISLLIAVGATWCGASAISAVSAVVGSSSKNVSLSISVVALFTAILTFVQAYFAVFIDMNERVAGAWIGASVDQTGNVIASAAIVSEEATNVAGIVKMVLNSGLGILATVVALWWQSFSKVNEEGDADTKKFSFMFLWDKFPKFVLGYLICSAFLTVALPLLEGRAEEEALQPAVSSLNKWLFAMGFVGIGASTNIKEMWESAIKSGAIKLYLVVNTIDVLLALGLSYSLFLN